jgi:hypothetical protein
LSVLAALFGNTTDKSPDSEKLLHLYWNRAELKKAFAGMRKEQYRLQDRIKQQEGATARLQQKLDHLEGLLLDPEWASNIVVFYQLRGLARRCERKLAKFAEQLKQQREQKQHNGLLVRWNESRTREGRALESSIRERQEAVLALEQRLEAERQRLLSMSGFLKVFRKRSITVILDDLREQIETAQQEEFEFQQRLDEIRRRKPPENQGLDIATKRSINFMILAYAQQLFIHFDDREFAAMAKEASDKSVGSIKYGSRSDCEHILDRVFQRVEAMEKNTDFANVLQQRARLIGEKAQFRNDDDAVPVAASLTDLFEIDGEGKVTEGKARILGENYWDVAKILSRRPVGPGPLRPAFALRPGAETAGIGL